MSTTPQFFDVHTHAHFVAFKEDSDEVIRRALEAGVAMVNVGTQRDTSRSAVETAERYAEGVYATVGLHPIHTERSYHDDKELGLPNPSAFGGPTAKSAAKSGSGFVSRGEDFDYEYYKALAQHPKVVAIGECGLDYYRILNLESRILQENVFRKHIMLAQEVHKPLMIHCRNAFNDLISIVRDSKFQILNSNSNGVVHFFTGTVDDARKLLDLGFSFPSAG